MLHTQRKWNVLEVSLERLILNLRDHSWTLCTGFLCNGVRWLNDSTSEDSIEEWGVVVDRQQVESVTFWPSNSEGHEKLIRDTQATALGNAPSIYGEIKRGSLDHGESCFRCR